MSVANFICIRFLFAWLLVFLTLSFVTASAQQKTDSIHVATTRASKAPDTSAVFKSAESIFYLDSIRQTKLSVKPQKKLLDSKKAYQYSLFIPGGGQVYNKRYWKVPLIYAGFAGLIYSVIWNGAEYTKYQVLYKGLTEPNYFPKPKPSERLVSADQVLSNMGYHKRNRTLTIIGFVALYLVQVVDAYVDAQLSGFDVSDNLSLQITPCILPNSPEIGILAPNYLGVKMALTFKR